MNWLRSPRFDVWLQLGALAAIAPALAIHASLNAERAASFLPLASLIAIPFLHVFGSFFFAFSKERNQSASPPRRLGVQGVLWAAAAAALLAWAPRALASFALLYGGWHILRQNFGFLRELAGRAGLGGDRVLRRLDLLACATPALALWLLISARGPWLFIAAEVYHLPVPTWLLALAFAAVPLSALLRERRLVLPGHFLPSPSLLRARSASSAPRSRACGPAPSSLLASRAPRDAPARSGDVAIGTDALPSINHRPPSTLKIRPSGNRAENASRVSSPPSWASI